MSDKIEPTIGDPDASPDYLAAPTKRGKGVRRLNRVPLFIVGALVVLAVLAITYTFFQRQAAQRGVATSPIDPGNVAAPATAPIRPETSIPPAPPAPPTDSPVVPPIEGGQPAPANAPATTPPVDPELEARLRLIRRVDENRFAAHEAALGADPNVQAFAQRGAANGTAAGAATGGQTPAQLAGLAGAAEVLRNAGVAGGAGAGGLNLGGGDLAALGGQGDPNQQDHKRAFLSQSPELETYLKHTRTPPVSTMEVKAGTVIPGVMIGGINSDLPGQIIGQVRENVYDTATGQYLLIPAGARLVGTYDSTVTMGQERVLVAWRRIIYPDGSSVSLDLMPGADTGGYAGFNDKVNNHYWRIFGNALMLSLFSAGIQLSQPQGPTGPYGGYDSQQILAAEIGRQLGQLGMEMARRNLSIQPTLEIRPGYRFVVMVTKDIVLPPWQGHPLATSTAGRR